MQTKQCETKTNSSPHLSLQKPKPKRHRMATKRKSQDVNDGKILDIIGLKFHKMKETKGKPPQNVYKLISEKTANEQNSIFMLPGNDSFQLMPKSKAGDWLSEHREIGQSFRDFSSLNRLTPTDKKKTIYLIPLTFAEDVIPTNILESMKEYAEVFFDLPIKIGKMRNMKEEVPNRINEMTNNFQVDASEVLRKMLKFVPRDAFCAAGITMCDLYPRESWNFVFGLANLAGRCGVYSLARYLSTFGETENTIFLPERESGGESEVLKRACKVMCHEIGHMFGLMHCIHFKCLMNGSNSLEESDRKPVFLCPVCLHKLFSVLHFDLEDRYKKMHKFWTMHGQSIETAWIEKRLAFVSSI